MSTKRDEILWNRAEGVVADQGDVTCTEEHVRPVYEELVKLRESAAQAARDEERLHWSSTLVGGREVVDPITALEYFAEKQRIAVEAERAQMECGHPAACAKWVSEEPMIGNHQVCLACSREARAVEKGMLDQAYVDREYWRSKLAEAEAKVLSWARETRNQLAMEAVDEAEERVRQRWWNALRDRYGSHAADAIRDEAAAMDAIERGEHEGA